MDLSALRSGKLKTVHATVDVLRLVRTLVRVHRPFAVVPIHFTIHPGVPLHLFADSTRIQQVLANGLTNASKFTPSGYITVEVLPGTAAELAEIKERDKAARISQQTRVAKAVVEVSSASSSNSMCSSMTITDPATSITLVDVVKASSEYAWAIPGEWVLFRIINTGPGLNQTSRDQLFEPYTRAAANTAVLKKQHGGSSAPSASVAARVRGSGLGLPMSKMIVEKVLAGHIDLYDTTMPDIKGIPKRVTVFEVAIAERIGSDGAGHSIPLSSSPVHKSPPGGGAVVVDVEQAPPAPPPRARFTAVQHDVDEDEAQRRAERMSKLQTRATTSSGGSSDVPEVVKHESTGTSEGTLATAGAAAGFRSLRLHERMASDMEDKPVGAPLTRDKSSLSDSGFEPRGKGGSAIKRTVVVAPDAPPPAVAPPLSLPIVEAPRSLHVLYVEDELVNRKFMTRFCKGLPILLSTLEDGMDVAAALAATGQLPDPTLQPGETKLPVTHVNPAGAGLPYDVLLLDIVMARSDGQEVCTSLRSRGVKLPICAVTGNSTNVLAGFDHVLPKPFQKADLVDVLAKCCEGWTA